tara:strand:+ start:2535 stop:2693 length:159 start_codon:yes stop_codon:yes gene_type:complete
MNTKRKYENLKLKVNLAEKSRETSRDSKSWFILRDLKKKKLALRDALLTQNI